jgi:hypothetical protein
MSHGRQNRQPTGFDPNVPRPTEEPMYSRRSRIPARSLSRRAGPAGFGPGIGKRFRVLGLTLKWSVDPEIRLSIRDVAYRYSSLGHFDCGRSGLQQMLVPDVASLRMHPDSLCANTLRV